MAINELRSISIFVSAAELGSLRKGCRSAGHHAASGQPGPGAARAAARRTPVPPYDARDVADGRRQAISGGSPDPRCSAFSVPWTRATRGREEIAGPLRIVGPRSTFPRGAMAAVGRVLCSDTRASCRTCNWRTASATGSRTAWTWASASALQRTKGVIARRLFPVQLVICATPAYLHRYGAPETLAALQSHRCSVFRHPATGAVLPWDVKVGHGDVDRTAGRALRSARTTKFWNWRRCSAGVVIGQLAGVTAAPYIRWGTTCAAAGRPHARPRQLLCVLRQPHRRRQPERVRSSTWRSSASRTARSTC